MSPIDRLLRRAVPGLAMLACALPFCAGQVWGQSYGAQATSLLAMRASDELHPQFEVAYTTPALYKWYGPRNLPTGYLRPWYQNQLTSYAEQHYQRYLEPSWKGSSGTTPSVGVWDGVGSSTPGSRSNPGATAHGFSRADFTATSSGVSSSPPIRPAVVPTGSW